MGTETTRDESEDLSRLFERVDDPESLTPDDFLERFERVGFLWFRSGGSGKLPATATRMPMPTGNQILGFVGEHSASCEASWSVENHGTIAETDKTTGRITPKTLEGFTGTSDSFYVSTIVHRSSDDNENTDEDDNDNDGSKDDSSKAHKSLMKMLPRFDNVFEDLYEIGEPSGTWLFLGHHGVSGSAKKKRKRETESETKSDNEAAANTLVGRAEHVDEVTHSGTYHIQIAGTKTWKIRPHPDSMLAEELSINGSVGDNGKNKRNRWNLEITVEEGDVFVLNTKIWYHRTELNYKGSSNDSIEGGNNSSASEWSISAAHDFYLPVPCPRDVKKRESVFANGDEKEGSDEEIPEDLPRSANPNCVLIEIDAHGDAGDSDADDRSAASGTEIALVALRDIAEGESLSIAFDDDADRLGNASEQMDPRAISDRDWKKGQAVLEGEDRIPADLPRSYEPSCELVDTENEDLMLRALVDIPAGGVFCVLPDDDEEYEEVEVDLGTGELVR